MPKSFLHLLNLDTVGGVEELFIHFLAYSSNLSASRHHLLVTGKKPHPFFAGRIKSLTTTCTLEKFAYGFKIPLALRPLQRKRAVSKSKPNVVVLWNRFEELSHFPNAHIVYYEHGASWIEPQNKDSKAFFNRIDQILVNSYAAKRVLELKWGVTSPITIIENPLKPTLAPASNCKKIPDSRSLRLGYIGRLIPLKGVATLVHAIKTLRDRRVDAKLLIAGHGSEQPNLEKEAKKLGIEKHIQFLGCIQDVSAFYDKIDLLVVPSIREPLGLVAQEAALRGCPVIASAVDGLPEVVQHEKTGFTIAPSLSLDGYKALGASVERLPDLVYDPVNDALATPKCLDPADIASAAIAIFENPALYQSMSSAAIAFAKSRPTFRSYSEELLSQL
jgi:glycosyltransferase involved in cell wall biosynthesis